MDPLDSVLQLFKTRMISEIATKMITNKIVTHQHNAPCPLEMEVQWVLSSWVACTSCGAWGGSLQQGHVPQMSVKNRLKLASWSPAFQASLAEISCECHKKNSHHRPA